MGDVSLWVFVCLFTAVLQDEAWGSREVGRNAVAEPQVAMLCGKLNMYMDVNTGEWRVDPAGTQSCLAGKDQILTYCAKVYPELQISGVTESKQPVKIDRWCKKGKKKCVEHVHIVVPFRCLVGEFVSEALLVPDRCKFLHQEQMDLCESHFHWHSVAKEACRAETLELHSYGMLLPCELESFRGVEYVCCPNRTPRDPQTLNRQSPHDLFSDGVELLRSGETEEGNEEEEVEKGEREEDRRPWNDYSDTGLVGEEFYADPPLPTLSPTSTGKITALLPSPDPTDGVDVYFETPTDENEHAHFLRAKMDLEEKRMNRINEVMREWAAADRRAKNAPNTDRMALNKHFQQILGTLEEQVASERQRLTETHLSRVLALLNDDRRMALESYLNALQTRPLQPSPVLQSLLRYVRAEQRDRRHSVRHYEHVASIDPQRAREMKYQVVTHLRIIEERMNQSLALLFHVPQLAKELGSDIEDLLRADRMDTEELLIELRLGEREEERRRDGENEDGEKEEGEKVEGEEGDLTLNPPTDSPPSPPAPQDAFTSVKGLVDYYDPLGGETLQDQNFVNEYGQTVDESAEVIYNTKTSPGLQRDELEPGASVSGRAGGTFGSLMLAAVAIAVVVVLSLVVSRRRNRRGAISHGIVEVDPILTPEDRQLSKMQNHGYENPTYKFFEERQN